MALFSGYFTKKTAAVDQKCFGDDLLQVIKNLFFSADLSKLIIECNILRANEFKNFSSDRF